MKNARRQNKSGLKSYKQREKGKLVKELKKIKKNLDADPYKLKNYYDNNQAFKVPPIKQSVQDELIDKGLDEFTLGNYEADIPDDLDERIEKNVEE